MGREREEELKVSSQGWREGGTEGDRLRPGPEE
jgi:hypothetical protein